MLDEPSAGELTSIITTEHFTLQTARRRDCPGKWSRHYLHGRSRLVRNAESTDFVVSTFAPHARSRNT